MKGITSTAYFLIIACLIPVIVLCSSDICVVVMVKLLCLIALLIVPFPSVLSLFAYFCITLLLPSIQLFASPLCPLPPNTFCFPVLVCVLHLQIPTGPLIFNSLQQQQLSQFSPQQSQSATSSPQQQGETVSHIVSQARIFFPIPYMIYFTPFVNVSWRDQ